MGIGRERKSQGRLQEFWSETLGEGGFHQLNRFGRMLGVGVRRSWECSFGVPTRCPRAYVEDTVGYMSLEFGEDLNLEVISK